MKSKGKKPYKEQQKRLDNALAVLDLKAREAASNRAVSKILNTVLPELHEFQMDFVVRAIKDGFYSKNELEKHRQHAVILGDWAEKNLTEAVLKEWVISGERSIHGKTGGGNSAITRKKTSAKDDIIKLYLLYQACDNRRPAADIAKRLGKTPTYIRKIIREYEKNETEAK